MVSTPSCAEGRAAGSAWLLAIFRRKLRVAIRLLDMLGGALLTDY
jgi:hypothetical protein